MCSQVDKDADRNSANEKASQQPPQGKDLNPQTSPQPGTPQEQPCQQHKREIKPVLLYKAPIPPANLKVQPVQSRFTESKLNTILKDMKERLSGPINNIMEMNTEKADEMVACNYQRPRVMTNYNGTFTSLNYPNYYPSSYFCEWRIITNNVR